MLRFGAELNLGLYQAKQVEVVIINQGKETTFEEELASDVLEFITVFSAGLCNRRSHRNQKLIDGMRTTVRDWQCTRHIAFG
ncbi:hypothetical protein [Telluria beijingensis]|uniref:hypothetical protein n=1 Tax=Telluria beijingensis TaxID=3068633 RepID=UPI003BF5854C